MTCQEARDFAAQSRTLAAQSRVQDDGELALRKSILEAAAVHLATCPECRTRLDRLGKAVLSGASDEISCAECSSGLDRLVDAAGAGTLLAPAFPREVRHLAGCPECLQEWQVLAATLADWRAGSLAEPPRTPAVDTAFLRTPQLAPRPILDRSPEPAGRSSVPALRMAWSRAAEWLIPSGWSPRAAAVAALVLLLLVGTGAWAMWRAGRAESGPPTAGTAIPLGAAHPTPPLTPTGVVRLGTPGLAPPSTGADAGQEQAASRDALATSDADAATRREAGTADANRRSTAAADAHAATARATRLALIPSRALPTFAPATPTPMPAATTDPADEGGDEGQPKPSDTPNPPPSGEAIGPIAERCSLDHPQLSSNLHGSCGDFPARSAYDAYAFTVSNRSLWRFATCERTEMDTLLALYPAGGFDPANPCDGRIGFNDDRCDEQSELDVSLDPGDYILVVAEKTGDASASYSLRVYAQSDGQSDICAR